MRQLGQFSVGGMMKVEAGVGRAEMEAAGRARVAKLTDGAHQFEAMMLGEMLKGLNFGGVVEDGGDGEEAAGAAGTIAGYGTEALARAISQGGGFGLAAQIVREVTVEDRAKGAGTGAAAGGKV